MDSDQTIRICHLASGDLWGGAEVQIHTLLTTLNRNPKVEMSAILLNNGRLADKLSTCGIADNLIDESNYSFLAILGKLRTHLAKIQPDILHTHRYKEYILTTDTLEKVAEQVLTLMNNPDLRRSIEKNARELAEKEYSWTIIGRILNQMYSDLA